MSWKHVKGRPRVEEAVDVELTRRRLLNHENFFNLDTVIVLTQPPMFIAKEEFTKQMEKRYITDAEYLWTLPDRIVRTEPPTTIYYDGPHHRQKGIANRDAKIDRELAICGLHQWRFQHRGGEPTKRWLKYVCDQIEKLITDRDKRAGMPRR